MDFSNYQTAIFDAVGNPAGGNLIIEAVAGSGKTTTIVGRQAGQGLAHHARV